MRGAPPCWHRRPAGGPEVGQTRLRQAHFSSNLSGIPNIEYLQAFHPLPPQPQRDSARQERQGATGSGGAAPPPPRMGAGASKAEPRHRSLNCRTATIVEFVNDTDEEVQTLWLGYDGTERPYYTLRPGQRVRQPTFTAHPWLFRSPGSPDMQLVVQHQAVFYAAPPPAATDASPCEARITVAVGVPWCPSTHAGFPPAFHAEAAALLCCHRRLASSRLRVGRGNPAASPGGCWLRRLGRTLSGQLEQAVASTGPQAAAPTSAAGLERGSCLGDLPKDVVLEVLALAAPFVPLVVKPPLPHAVVPEELTAEQQQLFQLASSAGPGAAAVAAGMEAAAPAGPGAAAQ